MLRFPEDPHEADLDADVRVRRRLIASLAAHPQPADRETLEEAVLSSDIPTSMMAVIGLRRLFPPPEAMNQAWHDMFGESIQLLTDRATSGPYTLRLGALQALAFAPGGLSLRVGERILEHLTQVGSVPGSSQHPHRATFSNSLEGGSLFPEPRTIPLVQQQRSVDLPEGFGLILSILPSGADRVALLQRELATGDPRRVLPVLLSLQLVPVPELGEDILGLVRSSDPRVSTEAMQALLAIQGPKVFPLLISLLKETTQPQKKIALLGLLPQIGKL